MMGHAFLATSLANMTHSTVSSLVVCHSVWWPSHAGPDRMDRAVPHPIHISTTRRGKTFGPSQCTQSTVTCTLIPAQGMLHQPHSSDHHLPSSTATRDKVTPLFTSCVYFDLFFFSRLALFSSGLRLHLTHLVYFRIPTLLLVIFIFFFSACAHSHPGGLWVVPQLRSHFGRGVLLFDSRREMTGA